MLCAGAGEVGRVPAADAKLSGLFVGNKPMVGLPLLGSTDVTRYGLPDHGNPFTSAMPNRRVIGLRHHGPLFDIQFTERAALPNASYMAREWPLLTIIQSQCYE
jgi:hypothetical protein